MKSFIFSLLLFCTLPLISQDTTITIYFKSGQSRLNSAQQKSIDNLQLKPVTKITVDGYADTVGRASFNKKLSYKRAQTTAKTIDIKNKAVSGKGECKEKKVALNKMRKVIVKVWYAPVPVEPKQVQPKKDSVVFVDPCTEDTILYSPSGSMIKINKCYYLKIKHCFKYEEYINATDIQQAGLRTVDERGDPIESGGMINITGCNDSCFKKPVVVLLPVPKCLTQQQMTMWTVTKNNQWRNSQTKIEIVKIKDKEYYKMLVYCPGKLNCDKPKKEKRKIKVKLKNGLKAQVATLSYNCPLYSMGGKIKKRKKLIVFPYVCPQEDPLLYLKAVTKTGDTVIINNRNINQYTRRQKLRSHCNCITKPKEKYMGIFKIRQKYLYRKYKVYAKDCVDRK